MTSLPWFLQRRATSVAGSSPTCPAATYPPCAFVGNGTACAIFPLTQPATGRRAPQARSPRIVNGGPLKEGPSAPVAGRQTPLNHLRVARHAETEHPEDEAGEHIAGHGRRRREPLGVGQIELNDAEHVEQPDDEHEARILEETNEAIDDAGD